MGINDSGKCAFCKTSSDGIDHIVEEWIVNIDFTDYKLNDNEKIYGDIENCAISNLIILLT